MKTKWKVIIAVILVIILTGLFILLIIISMQIINSSTGNYDRYYLRRKLNDKELV